MSNQYWVHEIFAVKIDIQSSFSIFQKITPPPLSEAFPQCFLIMSFFIFNECTLFPFILYHIAVFFFISLFLLVIEILTASTWPLY